jgi:hypothetical protein
MYDDDKFSAHRGRSRDGRAGQQVALSSPPWLTRIFMKILVNQRWRHRSPR